jgi:hypothetical protein
MLDDFLKKVLFTTLLYNEIAHKSAKVIGIKMMIG